MLKRASSWVAASLLALEGTYFMWFSASMYGLYVRAEGGASAGTPIPAAIWQQGAIGFLLSAAAVAYAVDAKHVRRTAALAAPLLFLYGMWAFSAGVRSMGSWRSVFELDLIALGAASGAGFMLAALSCAMAYRNEG